MRFAESPLKYLLLPLVPLTAIGIIEFVDLATTEYAACCLIDERHPRLEVDAPHHASRTAPPA